MIGVENYAAKDAAWYLKIFAIQEKMRLYLIKVLLLLSFFHSPLFALNVLDSALATVDTSAAWMDKLVHHKIYYNSQLRKSKNLPDFRNYCQLKLDTLERDINSIHQYKKNIALQGRNAISGLEFLYLDSVLRENEFYMARTSPPIDYAHEMGSSTLGLQVSWLPSSKYSTPVILSYQKVLNQKISVGGFAGYFSQKNVISQGFSKEDPHYQIKTQNYKYDYITLAAKGVYHFNTSADPIFKFNIEHFDIYVSAFVGLSMQMGPNPFLKNNKYDQTPLKKGINIGLLPGIKYMLDKNLGFFAELGYSRIGLVNFGMCYRILTSKDLTPYNFNDIEDSEPSHFVATDSAAKFVNTDTAPSPDSLILNEKKVEISLSVRKDSIRNIELEDEIAYTIQQDRAAVSPVVITNNEKIISDDITPKDSSILNNTYKDVVDVKIVDDISIKDTVDLIAAISSFLNGSDISMIDEPPIVNSDPVNVSPVMLDSAKMEPQVTAVLVEKAPLLLLKLPGLPPEVKPVDTINTSVKPAPDLPEPVILTKLSEKISQPEIEKKWTYGDYIKKNTPELKTKKIKNINTKINIVKTPSKSDSSIRVAPVVKAPAKTPDAIVKKTNQTGLHAKAPENGIKNAKPADLQNIPEPIVVKALDANDLVFHVQIGSFNKKISKKKFAGVSDLITINEKGGYTRCMTGSFSNYKEASDYKLEMIDKGFSGAFVVAYSKGTRVSLQSIKKSEK